MYWEKNNILNNITEYTSPSTKEFIESKPYFIKKCLGSNNPDLDSNVFKEFIKLNYKDKSDRLLKLLI